MKSIVEIFSIALFTMNMLKKTVLKHWYNKNITLFFTVGNLH